MKLTDPELGTPRFQRLSEILRAEIERGDLRPGEWMPSEARLAEQHRVGRGTVRRALTVLEQDGLIEICAGRGRRVNDRARSATRNPPAAAYEEVAADL